MIGSPSLRWFRTRHVLEELKASKKTDPELGMPGENQQYHHVYNVTIDMVTIDMVDFNGDWRIQNN